jgi:hypothetical protein
MPFSLQIEIDIPREDKKTYGRAKIKSISPYYGAQPP